jgi:hypothetical protein
MRIPTKDVPQADQLRDVLKVVEAVGGGSSTDRDIGDAIGKVDRQGRYYRRAAELLGLVKSAGANQSILTDLGAEYVSAIQSKKQLIALQAVLSTRVFQRAIVYLESKLPEGCRQEDFTDFLEGVTQATGKTMMPRRVSTLISWLRSLGLVVQHDNRYVLCPLPQGFITIPCVEDAEPLLPRAFALSDYKDVERRASANAGIRSHLVDEAKVERANESHAMLTNLVAAKVRQAGGIPRCNNLVDIAARINGTPFIFEVKSTTPANARSQMRSGISQLYEYRYFQSAPDARLVLVIENPLGAELAWMAEYLGSDRGIMLAWDGDRRRLHCGSNHRAELDFLVA